MNPHEEAFLRSFVTPAYRDRCRAKKCIPRDDLWHRLPSKLDERHTFELPANVHLPKRVHAALEQLGPVGPGYCISAWPERNGTTVRMDEAGDLEATIVSFRPGVLAYYESEAWQPAFRCLLVRDPALEQKLPGILRGLSDAYRRADAQK